MSTHASLRSRRAAVVAAIALLPLPALAQGTRASDNAQAAVQAPEPALPLKHAPRPTTPAITAADLTTRLYIFADDSMLGREAGTLGNYRGTEYLAREAQRLGLLPAGENGTWFQTIPFKTRSVDSASTLAVTGAPVAFGREWVASATTSVKLDALPVVYGGTIGDSASMLAPAQAAGKLVVYTYTPAAARTARRASRLVPAAAAVAVVGDELLMSYFRRSATFVDDPSSPAQQAPPLLVISPAAGARMFDAPIPGLKAGAPGKPASLDVRVVIAPVAHPTRNVVALLPGSDARLRGQYVAIGAHNDHVGYATRAVDHDSIRIFNRIVRPGGAEDAGKEATAQQQGEVNRLLAAYRAAHPGTSRRDSINNGADDDGSGSVAVLEIAERMATASVKPRRSVLFVWHTGEEKGLLGASYFTDHPTVPRDSIVAQLNLDMVGRGNAWDVAGRTKDGQPIRGNPDYVQLVGSRRLSKELGDLVETVNRENRHGLRFDYSIDANGHPANIYCRSDHYEYARYGIPITFFTTGVHSDYHQVTDEPQYIDYERMARIARLVDDVAIHVANAERRLDVDQPKPDPRGVCRQ